MNPFILSPPERIRSWRSLREDIKGLDSISGLTKVNSWWWQAPIVQFSLDYDRPETWPTPWEMMYENEFDSTAKAYMMAETLVLSEKVEESDLEIQVINCKKIQEVKSTLVVFGEYILNYNFDGIAKLVDIQDFYAISRLKRFNTWFCV